MKTALLGVVHLSIGKEMNYIELDGWQTIKDDICLKRAQETGHGKNRRISNIELQTAISHCAKLRIAVDIGALLELQHLD